MPVKGQQTRSQRIMPTAMHMLIAPDNNDVYTRSCLNHCQ